MTHPLAAQRCADLTNARGLHITEIGESTDANG